MRRHLAVLMVLLTGAYCVGLAPLVISTIAGAEHGAPYLLSMLTGVAGMLAAIAVGYTAGVLSGTAWLAPITFACVFAGIGIAAHEVRGLEAAIPVSGSTGTLGMVEPYSLLVYRLAACAIIVGAAAWFSARALRRSRRWKVPSPTSSAIAVILIATILLPVSNPPALFAKEGDLPASCTTASGVEYCVHAGQASQLDLMRDTTRKLLAVSGVQPQELRRVWSVALADDAGAGDSADGNVDSSTVWIGLYPGNDTATETAFAVAQRLSGLEACGAVPSGTVTDFRNGVGAAQAFYIAMLRSAGHPDQGYAVETPFDHLSSDELASWGARHAEAIRNCALNETDMP
ncbi:hypothetical protein H0B56_18785 [Haloechinothrix sp. YIM 98757]|uniref:Uncharacterized protein n=2 Tax=Haloechinothrix aidingensis TaxID=2752311 RepID=A0A838AEM0_9PSEU|nr:hypothetical protein [Haloechinothrix aidingensis]